LPVYPKQWEDENKAGQTKANPLLGGKASRKIILLPIAVEAINSFWSVGEESHSSKKKAPIKFCFIVVYLSNDYGSCHPIS
jgi:hypothetical protein